MKDAFPSRPALTAALLVCIVTAPTACSDSQDPVQPTSLLSAPDLPNASATTRIVLRAWEDTRAGLPPLAVTRRDSVDLVVAFVRARSEGWQRANSLPGIALPAEFYVGDRVAQRFGILDLPGDTGFFVSWQGTQAHLRPASDVELGQFLAFFGVNVVTIE